MSEGHHKGDTACQPVFDPQLHILIYKSAWKSMEDERTEQQSQPFNAPMDIDDPDEVMNEPGDIIPEAHTSSITIKLSYLLYKERQSGDPLDRSHFFKITPNESVPDWTGNISEASFEEFKNSLFTHVTTSRKIRRILDIGDCSGRLYFYVSANLGQPLGVCCPLHGIHFCSFTSFVAEAMRQPEQPITIILSMRHVGRRCVADGTVSGCGFCITNRPVGLTFLLST
jgi:hypothetical protein